MLNELCEVGVDLWNASDEKLVNIFLYGNSLFSYIQNQYILNSSIRYIINSTLVPCKVTRSTKLQGAQRAPELALRSIEFCSPVNLIFPALILQIIRRSTFKTSNTIKRVCIFHLILVGIPSILILSIKNE